MNCCKKRARKAWWRWKMDIEEPDKSPLFSKYEDFAKNHHAVAFVCDTMRMAVSGGVEVFDLDQMLEADMEVHHHEASEPVSALTTMADSLPGLGIVAAVLGVVITMGALGGPPEEIGKKVAAALVGTFLGILLCYGLVGPLASRMGKMADEEHAFLLVLRVTMIAFLKGVAPIMAVEIGRRTVPGHVRPSFQAVEEACRGAKGGPGGGARPAECDRPLCHGINHVMPTHPSSSSRKKAAMAAITAAPGRSPMPTSSRP